MVKWNNLNVKAYFYKNDAEIKRATENWEMWKRLYPFTALNTKMQQDADEMYFSKTYTSQFCVGNPYFFSETLYQSVSFICIEVSQKRLRDSYRDAVCKKIMTLCNKNWQPAAKNQNRSFARQAD